MQAMKIDEDKIEAKRKLSELLIKEAKLQDASLRQLAAMADISPASINNYVNLIAFPSEEVRRKVARSIFKISLEELDAKIEDRPVERQSSVEQVCREIRLMEDAELLEVLEELSRQISRRFRPSAL